MKYLLFLSLLVTASAAWAQPESGIFNDAEFSKQTADIRDLSGKPIPTGDRVGVEGNPMLNDEFARGVVQFKDGRKLNVGELNFSLAENQLHFKKDSKELMFAEPVANFIITDKSLEKIIYFKNGYPAIKGNTGQTFYEVLFDGTHIQLLKHVSKVVEERDSYGGPHRKIYARREHLFLYDVKSGKMQELGRNINSVKRSLPLYASYIDDVSSKNKWNVKQEDQLVSLIEDVNRQIPDTQ